MLTEKNAPNVLLYDTVYVFLILYQVFSYKSIKSDVPSALKTSIFQQLLFKFLSFL